MSTFTVAARQLTIDNHPDPEVNALEIARVDDYVAVVPKGQYATGDTAIYIPEGAIVPDDIIAEMGLEGRLAGGTLAEDGSKHRNRVKAIRLRGVLSQGLVYSPNGRLGDLEIGKDYAEILGITKYQPPVPAEMSGKVEAGRMLPYTEIENIKRFPSVLRPGEEVIAVEKAHGTCTLLHYEQGTLYVSSKGLGKQGLVLLRDSEDDSQVRNVYWRMAIKHGIESLLKSLCEARGVDNATLYGETTGVQDLRYGLMPGELGFHAFDLRIDGQFVDYDDFVQLVEKQMGLPTLPVLYRGPYSREKLEEVAVGREQITGTESHIREGVVVRPVKERTDPDLGRVIVKVISPDYLLRKGSKGVEATEFE